MIRKLIISGISIWWLLAALIAFISLFLFPFFKKLPIGLVPVLVGVFLALGLRYLPGAWKRAITQLLYSNSEGIWLLSVCLLALLLRLADLLLTTEPFSDHLVYFDLARDIASGRGYGDMVQYPPGQSGWLAFWVLIFGANYKLLSLVQILLNIATIPVLYRALRSTSIQAARWSAVALAFMPSIVLWSGTLGHETTSTFLLALILFCFHKWSHTANTPKWRWAIALGVASGVATLVHPTFILTPLFMAIAALYGKHMRSGRIATGSITALAVMFLVILPWSVRNYLVYDQICLVSANFGKVLLSSNHIDSDGVWMPTKQVAAELKACEKDKARRDLAIRHIVENPANFVFLSVKRLVYMWGTDTSVLSFVLGEPPRGGTLLKSGLSFLIQVPWALLVTAWLISVLRYSTPGIPQASDMHVLISLFIMLVWMVHFLVEPLSRHHLPYIPLISALTMPGYWQWVLAGGTQSLPEHDCTGRSA